VIAACDFDFDSHFDCNSVDILVPFVAFVVVSVAHSVHVSFYSFFVDVLDVSFVLFSWRNSVSIIGMWMWMWI